jgi:hypothetical protein
MGKLLSMTALSNLIIMRDTFFFEQQISWGFTNKLLQTGSVCNTRANSSKGLISKESQSLQISTNRYSPPALPFPSHTHFTLINYLQHQQQLSKVPKFKISPFFDLLECTRSKKNNTTV